MKVQTINRGPGRALAVSLALVAVLGPVGIDMYLASMPKMASELGASYAEVQLSLTLFLVALGAGQLLWGPLTDMLGRRRPLLAGVALYIGAAIWCAQAGSLPALLAARAVQGLGAALTLVVVMSMVRDVADGTKAAQLFAMLMTIVGLAPVVAPAIGGLVDAHYGWRAVMLVLALLGVVTFLNSAAFLPETLAPAQRQVPTAILRRYATILADRAFLLPALALSASFFLLFAYIGGASLVYQRDFGLTPSSFGLVFGATGVAVLLGAMSMGQLVERLGATRLSMLGTLAMTGGALVSLLGLTLGMGLYGVLPGMFIALFGLGIAEATFLAMAMGSQQRHLGSTAALLGAIQMSLSSLATPIAAALADAGPEAWLAFLSAAGLLVSCLTWANLRINPAPVLDAVH